MAMTDTMAAAAAPIGDRELRGASAFQLLHWLVGGRIDSGRLVAGYREAIAARAALNAFTALDDGAPAAAAASDARRREGSVIGRLDGLPVAIKDNLDVAGMPTTAGVASRRSRVAKADSAVVASLRAAGAIILGKTGLDEAALGTSGTNPHLGAVRNPFRPDFRAGGSSAGSAAAVAAGLCAFAIGSDTLGSVRIPASFCGIYALKPTLGEIPTCGLVPAVRRTDSIGILARSVQDLAIVLQVLDVFDPADPRSRRRRVPLSVPDWQPGHLRTGLVADVRTLGVSDAVATLFDRAIGTLGSILGEQCDVDFADYDFARMRRAALLIMESELALEFAAELADTSDALSSRVRDLLRYAQGKSAVDYAAADRQLDQGMLKARRVFEEVDVLALPTVAHPSYALDEAERANDADLTSFASISGCPAVSLPMGTIDGLPVGLQLVGRPGADLRLLDLAEVCAATLDATPEYPVGRAPGSS
jgi:aspartyl-tRNA(Asn)/glutamyl-tRNA(Gln) amidotransferase subunit A